MLRVPLVEERTELTKMTTNGVAIDARLRELPSLPMGPFARVRDRGIVCAEKASALISNDEGESWGDHLLFDESLKIEIRPERAVLCTAEGTLILAFENERERFWTWDDELRDAPDAVMPTYVARSLDGGQTWEGVQKLHDEWTGAIRDMIQTKDGRVIFTTMKMLHDPGRHGVLTYSSDDEGATWEASNVIDLGGMGHHGGVTESTIVELSDGRILMYLRTNWEQFWMAMSWDGGLRWHPIGPSGVDASSAPGLLHRMASGRIALVWNRVYPEGEHAYPLRGGDGLWSGVPVSNHRGELALSFSEDEGESWSRPSILARKPDVSLSYPYLFEVSPGELWLTTMQGGLRLLVREEDFVA